MAPLLPLHKPSLQIHKNFEKNFLRTRHPANDSGCDTSINSSNFLLLDISKDLSYVAFVDTNFRLYVYYLKNDNDELKLSGRHIIKENLPMEHLNVKNTYLFLSVSSEGHAVVSSLEVDQHGNPIYRNMQQNKNHKEGTASKKNSGDENDMKNNFKGCRVFRHGFQGNLDIDFNGRAVYVDDRLVLVNTNSVCIHRRWNYSLLDIHKGIDDLVRVKKLDPPKVSWAYYISGELPEDRRAQPPKDNAAQKIISMTQLVKDEILMTFYSCNITKVWSLFDGSLITSIVLKAEESVMAVSVDRLHLATYNRKEKRVNLYDTETLLKLHSLSPKGIKMDETYSRVRAVRFCNYQHYLIISGINVYGDDVPGAKAEAFFEVWLIEKGRCIANSKSDGAFTRSPCPVIDITEIKKYYSMNTTSETRFYNFEFEGTFVNDFQDINEIGIKKTLIFEQKPSGIQDNVLWGKYKWMKIGKKQNEDKGIYYEITAPPIKDDEPFGKENALYVLRFGQRTVRLWELISTIEGSDNNKVLDFLNLVDEKYKDKSANLIFIRAYKGHHTESNFKDIWKISQQKDDESHIRFMNDAGRIMVDVEDAHSNKASKDEFFLPLPKLDRQPTNDFNEIESLSQAFYCLYYDHKAPKEDTHGSKSNDTKIEDNADDTDSICEPNIAEKIKNLLNNELFGKEKATDFFKTRSGNRALSMLASFDDGQPIFQDILINKNFPMTIFSFPKSEEESENFLTVLIKRRKYDLFELLFNEILYEYHQFGTNNLFPLMDTLLALRNVEIQGLLLRCTQKLSDIEINPKHSGLLSTEYHKKFSYSSTYHFTKIQYLKKYHSHWVWKLFYKITRSNKSWDHYKELDVIKDTKENLKRRRNMCIIPLPSYNVYNVFKYGCSVEDEAFSRSGLKGEKLEKKFHTLNVIEVLIDNKWRESARDGLFGILVIHLVYYVFYSLGISFPEEFFGYVPGTPIRKTGHLGCIAMMVTAGTFLFFQETVQMRAWGFSYFKSIFNYIDLAAFILPLTTLALLVTNGTYLYEVSSITILVLWIHFFLRLRVIPTVGTFSEIILRLAKKFFPIIFTLIMVVVAFTHSFIVLLRRKDDAFFQEKYQGSMSTANESDLLNGASMTLSDQSQQNPFKDVFLAFTTVWFFTSGTFDPVFSGDANSPMVTILAIMFSFCTGLIVLNVVIALMTGAIESTKKKGNRNWYVHYIAVVAEIELFWGLFFKKNDPIYVYYWTFEYKIKEKCKEFGKDIETLRSTLGFTKSRSKDCSHRHESAD